MYRIRRKEGRMYKDKKEGCIKDKKGNKREDFLFLPLRRNCDKTQNIYC